jgi:hypothetical protein
MCAERKERLQSMSFWTWDPLDTAWSARFNELVAYRTEHGRFPPRTMPGGLAAWIQTQRNTRATMDPERKERLDAISFVWDVPETVWSSKYDELIAYHAEHGRLPPESTPVLGTWIRNQRHGRSTMDPERKARLDAFFGVVVEPARRGVVCAVRRAARIPSRARHAAATIDDWARKVGPQPAQCQLDNERRSQGEARVGAALEVAPCGGGCASLIDEVMREKNRLRCPLKL